jgi:hypothetical protein
MKKTVCLGLLVFILVFGFIGCDNGNVEKTYTVTIGELTNANGCTITANPTSGVEGTEISLILTQENTYRLKAGTLKYGSVAINESTLKFILPTENIVITAEFESLLYGEWHNYPDLHYTEFFIFYEGIFLYGEINTRTMKRDYWNKGTWIPQGNNEAILNMTHYSKDYSYTLDSLTEEYNVPYIWDLEILSNSMIKMIFQNGNEESYKFIQ